MSAAAVLSATEAATTSYAAMDDELFSAAVARLDEALGCVRERLSPDQAAAVHRVHALRAFTSRDELATFAAFRAAHQAQPGYALTTNLAPPGGPLATQYAKAGAAPPSITTALPALKLEAHVDGRAATRMPIEVPALVQLGPAEAIRWTAMVREPGQIPAAFVAGGAPVVAEAPLVAEPPAKLPSGPKPAPSGGKRSALLAAAASGAVVTAGLYGGASAMRVSYDRDPRSQTRHAVNGLFFSALGVGLASGALGVAGLAAPAAVTP